MNGSEWWIPGIWALNCQAQYEEQVEQLKIDLELRHKASGCQPRQPRGFHEAMIKLTHHTDVFFSTGGNSRDRGAKESVTWMWTLWPGFVEFGNAIPKP